MQTIEARKKKWLDFMDISTNRRTIVLVRYEPEDFPPRPWPYPESMGRREDWAVDFCLAQMHRMEWLDDDRIPTIHPYTGTEIFAEAFGSKVHYPGDNMPFALPLCHSIEEAARLKVPDIHHTPLSDLFELARRIRQRVGAGPVVQLPDIQSPLDIAALVLEKGEFLMAMLDEPEAVKELVEKAKLLLQSFLDEWFREFGDEYIAHFPDFYMKGGFTFSEDEVGEFSTDLFEEFCLGPINQLSDRYGGCGMHCCANSLHQWGHFKGIHGLRLLNLVQEPALLAQAGETFGDALCHWHMYGIAGRPGDDSLVPEWVRKCPPTAHVVIEAETHSRQAAAELSARLREVEAQRDQ